jgi:hypothetical protein
MSRLDITNGDAAGGALKQSGVAGDVLPWRDVLHEGPVPGGIDDAGLARARAAFLSSEGWAHPDRDVIGELRARDDAIARAAERDVIQLWFEHDLYDQLQLLDVLGRLARLDLGDTTLRMVCIGEHPEVPDFRGLGQLTPEQLAALEPEATPVTREQLELATAGWAAFRADTPEAIDSFRARDLSPLPFMAAALHRLGQEYPWTRDGVSRSEHQLLQLVHESDIMLAALFAPAQDLEEAPFAGDLSFLRVAFALWSGPAPLLRFADGEAPPLERPPTSAWKRTLALTELGAEVLSGRADAVDVRGIDRWIGGVHLDGSRDWRWDADTGHIVER